MMSIPDNPSIDRRLLVFALLPSMTLHSSRWDAYQSAPFLAGLRSAPAHARIWHRHWSQSILRREKLPHISSESLAVNGVAVAMSGPAELNALARRVGAIVCGPRLRFAISGAEVRALESALGRDAFRLACAPAWREWGMPGSPFGSVQEACEEVVRTGLSLLRSAFRGLPDGVGRRAELKLPLESESGFTIGVDDAMALIVALQAATEARDVLPD